MKNQIIYKDCRTGLKTIPSKSCRTCVTSPPYYKLRDYGHKEQIGLEPTPELYIESLVKVFSEVKRTLTDDGTLWVVIGDSYAAKPQSNGNTHGANESKTRKAATRCKVAGGNLKPKDLIGIPWMLAFALRADGWYFRQVNIWNKPNCMPESVKDRCTTTHEYILLFSKRGDYYFDHEAIKEPCVWDTGGMTEARNDMTKEGNKGNPTAIKNGIRPRKKGAQTFGGIKAKNADIPESDPRYRNGSEQWGRTWESEAPTRNKRSVWTVATKPYKEAHFAVFPAELIVDCVKAGSEVGDTVIDPFIGSGTTGEVSIRLERNFIGFELNEDYEPLGKKRLLPHTNNLFTP